MEPANFIREFKHLAEEEWVPENGARVVAKAWTDPAFRERLFANGREAVTELGLSMPPHHTGTWSCWRTRRAFTT